jgi:hypothetical protein
LINQAFYPIDLDKDISLLTELLRMKGLRFILDNDNHPKGRVGEVSSPTLPTFLVSSSQHSLPEDIHIIQLDNGAYHQALDLSLPDTILLNGCHR